MKWTDPSQNATLTPPGCMLRLCPPLLYMPVPQLKPIACKLAVGKSGPRIGPSCISSPPSLQLG